MVARTPAKAETLIALGRELGLAVTVQAWGVDAAAGRSGDLDRDRRGGGRHAPAVAASAPLIFDAIYDPWPTVLAEARRGPAAR